MAKRAQQLAYQILEQMGLSIPVDVHAIATAHQVTIRTQPLEDAVSGVLVIKNERAVIGVNQNHHLNRQRFTIAHELGHFFLHRKGTTVFVDAAPIFFRDETSTQGSQRQEIEANAFAAELLMPERIIRQCVAEQPLDVFDEEAVQHLATKFEVSVQALTIRLTRLGLTTA